ASTERVTSSFFVVRLPQRSSAVTYSKPWPGEKVQPIRPEESSDSGARFPWASETNHVFTQRSSVTWTAPKDSKAALRMNSCPSHPVSGQGKGKGCVTIVGGVTSSQSAT